MPRAAIPPGWDISALMGPLSFASGRDEISPSAPPYCYKTRRSVGGHDAKGMPVCLQWLGGPAGTTPVL